MASHNLSKIKRITAASDHDWKELLSPCIVSFSFTVEQIPNLTYNRPSIIKEFAAPWLSWNNHLSICLDRYQRIIWREESSTKGKTRVGKALGDWLKSQVTRGLMAMAIRRPQGSRSLLEIQKLGSACDATVVPGRESDLLSLSGGRVISSRAVALHLIVIQERPAENIFTVLMPWWDCSATTQSVQCMRKLLCEMLGFKPLPEVKSLGWI